MNWDTTITEAGIWTAAATLLTQLGLKIRDERERYMQKRNGGTTEEKVTGTLLRIAEAHEHSAAMQTELLGKILTEAVAQRVLLQGGLERQADHGRVLGGIAAGIEVLKDRRGT